jgi:hypothetical protein
LLASAVAGGVGSRESGGATEGGMGQLRAMMERLCMVLWPRFKTLLDGQVRRVVESAAAAVPGGRGWRVVKNAVAGGREWRVVESAA